MTYAKLLKEKRLIPFVFQSSYIEKASLCHAESILRKERNTLHVIGRQVISQVLIGTRRDRVEKYILDDTADIVETESYIYHVWIRPCLLQMATVPCSVKFVFKTWRTRHP